MLDFHEKQCQCCESIFDERGEDSCPECGYDEFKGTIEEYAEENYPAESKYKNELFERILNIK